MLPAPLPMAPRNDLASPSAPTPGPEPWDLFCRVVDNLGDVGVCWRLATDFAGRGQPIRLWLDDASALGWMAPDRQTTHPGIELRAWDDAALGGPDSPEPGPVVIEAFGCDPPPAFVARMAAQSQPPRWINLEYLSAEAQAERNHRLPSPQFSGPGAGLTKTFFYPGFTPATGGLLREPGLLAAQAAFDVDAWLATRGLQRREGERVVSLFCYPNSPVDTLLNQLANEPTLLLATAGHASQQVSEALGPGLQRGPLRAVILPWLSQTDFDHLLWACDINWVRGEDSAVRAQWAGRPFVWQLYRQSDGADADKERAFLDRFLTLNGQCAAPPWAGAIRAHWRAWGAGEAGPACAGIPPLPEPGDWERHCLDWRRFLSTQNDLVSQLQGFAREAR